MPSSITDQSAASNGNVPSCLPVDNPGECFWQMAGHDLSNYRSTDKLPDHSDIVIIGAGYAGVATAYHLAQEHGELAGSITILEARSACSGATGRNGGHLRPDLYGHIPTFIDRAGAKAGAEIAEFEIAHVKAMKKFIEEENIDCDFTMARSFDVWCNKEAAKKAKAIYDYMVSEKFAHMDDVAFYTGDQVEGLCGVKGAVACASYTAGTIWPYKFIMHLIQKLVSSNKVNLQTNTPVLSIDADENGGYSIKSPRGQMHAKRVIHANNAYVSGLLPEYTKNIVPCKGICCRITVPDGVRAPLLNNSYIHRTDDNVLSYLIPRADGSIVVGGAAAKFKSFRDQWYDNVDDSVLIEAAKDYYSDYMQRTFNGWENTGASVQRIWSGVMGYSYDSNPHIGQVPARENQFILAGFNGHGMPVIWLASKEIAKMVAQGISFEETRMPSLFKTSQFRIDRAQKGREEDGDILGTGNFPATKQ
ncbi:FAD dependent oxidoreductase [Penicillium atrosanguineum]|uniref:FAD dependent oxidoreductase n=1 Tax=Penicillium atrosanguineum TaxID=1132637 RepID=A0A9W9PQE5_9EURO|nr:uncharacterized protein N7443_008206 [Penicillium atrosanguineum]KAJ5125126.1 FAD dependent oxidoreductase [Penicillium atrosanguineum]KAJ5135899.1 FAD dependent oxidoreductase [Penicillium atrosanguineum]KAJ5292253.1 hypothetical protein N7443_008206 [Penicillium atrosanguineum]KAJ5303727.1 FAD dependent oxidoreductase [Penicillium atrosanguineum]